MVEGRPAAAGRGMAAGAAEMQRDREAVRRAGGEDRPVALPPKRLQPARRDVAPGQSAIAGALLDFRQRACSCSTLICIEAFSRGSGSQKSRELPFVHRDGHGGAELDVALAAAPPTSGASSP